MATTSGLASGGTSWNEAKLFDRTFAAATSSQQPRRVIRGLALAVGAFFIVAAALLLISQLLPSAHG